MRIGTLVEKKSFGVPCNMVVNLFWRLEVNVIVIAHELSVIWNWIVSRKVDPVRKVILEFQALYL